MQNNFEKIRKALADKPFDALLITSEPGRYYATGFESSDGVCVVTKDDAWFFTDSRYIEAAENAISGANIVMTDMKRDYDTLVNEVIDKCGLKILGFEEQYLIYSQYERWNGSIKAKLKPAQYVLTDLRARKSMEELELMIKAQRIAEKSFNEILPMISTDITEKELSAELMYRFLKNGADDKSFDSIIVSAEHSSMPHGVPSDDKIKEGFLTIDFGVKLNGYCSDTTRTVCVGNPTDEMVKVYNTVLEAQLAGIAAAKAGVSGYDIDMAARTVIENAGYGEFFGHGFGHSLGIEIHEAPNANLRNKEPMPVGAVISAEPGIYLPGKFGVRIEDVLYLGENGTENITNLEKGLIIL